MRAFHGSLYLTAISVFVQCVEIKILSTGIEEINVYVYLLAAVVDDDCKS